jgi:hypothetical protein
MGGVRTCKLLLFLTCFLSICSSSRATFCTCVLVLLVQKYIYRQVSVFAGLLLPLCPRLLRQYMYFCTSKASK